MPFLARTVRCVAQTAALKANGGSGAALGASTDLAVRMIVAVLMVLEN